MLISIPKYRVQLTISTSLQQVAGIPEEKLVEAHGSFATASCTLCGMRHAAAMVKQAIVEGNVPIMCEAAKCKVISMSWVRTEVCSLW